MSAAVAYAPNRYHRVQMNTASFTGVVAVLLRCSCKHGIFIATRANYAPTKGRVCSSLKGVPLHCIIFRTATDASCGTAGFLVEAGENLRTHKKEEIFYDKEKKAHFMNHMFHGFDMDRTMLRIGAMNMMTHGVESPIIEYRDSLSDQNPDNEKYSLILANPPFKGSLDYDIVSADLLKVCKTKKTELLFLALFVRMLKIGGRCACIVPDGVLFGSSKAHKSIRKEIIENQRLEAVIGEVVKEIKGCILPKDTIVFAKIGEAVKLNRRAITSEKCLVDNNAMGLAPIQNKLRLDYFFYYMRNLKMERLAESTTVPSVRKSLLEELEIKIPSLEKQKEIGGILEKISAIMQIRKQQLEQLDLLIKARFLEMFGDPVQNEKNWKTKPLLAMGNCKNGMNFHYDDSGVEITCLGVSDFKDLSFINDTASLATVSLNKMPTEEYLLKDEDIVFVRSNGNKALVGRSLAIYPRHVPTTFSGFCIRYRKRDKEITVPYLLRVLKTDSMRKKMAGKGANIQNLNQKILGELVIPVPPLELQNEFATFVAATDKSKDSIKKSLDEAQLLFDSLMQKYFG